MASEFDAQFARDARPQLLAVLGESITRWPLGVKADAETVTAIVELHDETQPGQLTGGRAVRDENGEQVVRTGTLQLSDEQETDDRDRWVINSQRWNTVRELGRDAGMHTVLIERLEKIRTAKRSSRAR